MGGSAAWDGTAGTKWATVSGGTGGAAVPTSADDVYFDAASGASAIQTSNGYSPLCRNLNFTGFTGSLSFFGSVTSVIYVSGGLTLGSGMTVNSNTVAGFNFVATTDNGGAGWPITSNGKPMNVVLTFNGTGKWVLQDALSTTSTITFTAGALDTNSQNLSCGSFSATNASTRTLTLGSSAISAGSWVCRGDIGLTVTSNTAVLTLSGDFDNNSIGGSNYNGMSVVQTSTGSCTAAGGFGSTVRNYTRTGPASTAGVLTIGTSLTCTETFTVTGNSSINRVLVQSNTLGTQKPIIANSVSLTNTDFMDIAIIKTGDVLTSDSFDRANGNLAGSTTDAAAGGSPATWGSVVTLLQGQGASTATWSITSNSAQPNTLNYTQTILPLETSVGSDVAVQATIVTLPSGGAASWTLAARYVDSSNHCFITVDQSGSVRFGTTIADVESIVSTVLATVVAGDVLSLTVIGSTNIVRRNGTIIRIGNFTTAEQAAFGLGTQVALKSGFSSGSTSRFDNFQVNAMTSFTGTSLGDCLGNSGITFTTNSGTPRDGGGPGVKRYAVAPGNFSSTAMWSETDGGSPGASVPLPQDDVYLTASSAAGTYTINMPRAFRDITCTGFTRTLTASTNFSVYGSWTSGTGMTYGGSSQISYNKGFRGRGSHTIDTAGRSFADNGYGTSIIAPGGAYTLAGPMTNPSNMGGSGLFISLVAGTFNTANYDVETSAFQASGSLTKSFVLGTSKITARYSGNVFDFSPANTTVSAANATFVINSTTYVPSNMTFAGGSNTFSTLSYVVANDPYILTITGNNTIGTLNIGSGRAVVFPSNGVTKIGTLNVTGVYRSGISGGFGVGYAPSVPDSTALDISGDIDIQVRAATPLASAAQTLCAKWNSGGQRSYALSVIANTRRLQLALTSSITNSASAAQSTADIPYSSGVACWLRATWRASDGRVQYFTAPDSTTVPTSWTQLGTDIIHNQGSIANSTSAFTIGTMDSTTNPFLGTIYRARVLSGIDGTPAVDIDFSTPCVPWVDIVNNASVRPINAGTTNAFFSQDGRVVIESSTVGTASTLQVGNVTNLNYVDLKDIVVNGSDTYVGASSVIRSNVKGVKRGPNTGLTV